MRFYDAKKEESFYPDFDGNLDFPPSERIKVYFKVPDQLERAELSTVTAFTEINSEDAEKNKKLSKSKKKENVNTRRSIGYRVDTDYETALRKYVHKIDNLGEKYTLDSGEIEEVVIDTGAKLLKARNPKFKDLVEEITGRIENFLDSTEESKALKN